jgi:hypothetical protein
MEEEECYGGGKCVWKLVGVYGQLRQYECAGCGETKPEFDPDESSDYLDGEGSSCGLNADWSVSAWHFGPSSDVNKTDGDFYILDAEDGDHTFELVRRFYDDGGNDEVLEVAKSYDPRVLVEIVKGLLR